MTYMDLLTDRAPLGGFMDKEAEVRAGVFLTLTVMWGWNAATAWAVCLDARPLAALPSSMATPEAIARQMQVRAARDAQEVV